MSLAIGPLIGGALTRAVGAAQLSSRGIEEAAALKPSSPGAILTLPVIRTHIRCPHNPNRPDGLRQPCQAEPDPKAEEEAGRRQAKIPHQAAIWGTPPGKIEMPRRRGIDPHEREQGAEIEQFRAGETVRGQTGDQSS